MDKSKRGSKRIMDERQRQEMWQHVREGSKDLLVLWKDRTQGGQVLKGMLGQ